MTVELQLAQFTLDGEYISDIISNARDRSIAWESYTRTGFLASDEMDCLKEVHSMKLYLKAKHIADHADLYSTKMISLLSKAANQEGASNVNDDIIRYVLVSIIEAITYENKVGLVSYDRRSFIKSLLNISHVDESLPYEPLVKLLSSDDESIRLTSAYVITLLLADMDEKYTDKESILISMFDFITKLLSSTKTELNFLGVQMTKELLTIKEYRLFYWENQRKYFPSLLKAFSERKGELQMKYYSVMSIWMLTFIPQALLDIEKSYTEVIGVLYAIAKDGVKEKIVRMAIGALLNLLAIEKGKENVVKQFLLVKGLEITRQLIDRKWADDELKGDLEKLLEILNDAVTTLTTFDEYENELITKKLNWSPSHKSEEFWIENAEKFKENNWKVLKDLVTLLEVPTNDDDQLYLNQAIVCFDVGQIIKVSPEVVKILTVTGAKTKIMTLMSSPNSNVKFEALRTTQKLVAHLL